MYKSIKAMTMLALSLLLSGISFAKNEISIVPKPMEAVPGKGKFILTQNTLICTEQGNREVRQIAKLLVQRVNISTGYSPAMQDFTPGTLPAGSVLLTTEGADTALGPEGYTLEVTRKSVTLRAMTPKGLFYGIQSLFQLLPPEIEKAGSNVQMSIPAVMVRDMPRYGYRGLHLDVGRHLYQLDFIKKYIDLMAMYKLNTFHWHLTEDQGWRLEIKKYPKLTSVGSMRKGTNVGKTQESDQVPYGGFYTQDEAREIVAYAAARFITVIPEIEMPGHSVAALAAYPQYSCTGGPFEVRIPWGVSDDIYCAGNDSVFLFLQDILTEVMDIFPSAYIHIGGDEAPKARWKECPKCQARISAEGLKDEAELQSYFIKRIEKFLVSKNRRLIGWDEILEGGLAPEATVMAWRGIQAAIDAATQGHNAIMTPVDYCYFDYYQGDPNTEPVSIGGKTTLKTVYSYNPTPPVLNAEQARHILGVQGNVWTEYVKTPEAVQMKAFPRAIALAEVAWTPQESRNWDDFLNRLDNQFPRLDYMNVKYSLGSFAVDLNSLYDAKSKRNLVQISSETKGMDIRYTTDGTEPSPASKKYKKPFRLEASATVKAALFRGDKQAGPANPRSFTVNKASGKPVQIIKPYSFKYPGTGDQAITDGLLGSAATYKSGWQGYEGTDMELVVDLLEPTQFSSIKMNIVQDPGAWVMFPGNVSYYYSDNGNDWTPAGSLAFSNDETSRKTVKPAEVKFNPVKARYIKVTAKGAGLLPEWHPYKGQPCWLFTDELVVE